VCEMRITYLVKRWEHHTASGGYTPIARTVGGKIVSRSKAIGFMHRIGQSAWRRISKPRPYLLDYTYGDWVAEWRVLLYAWLNRPDVVHVLYGDEQLDVLLRRRRLLPCPLVATFHLPTWRVKARFEQQQKHLLGGIDMAIVVARSQIDDFEQWLGPNRVVYIPHGIDTDRFSPGDEMEKRPLLRLISVGEHMRDWESLHRIIDRCSTLKLPAEFEVIVGERHFPYFAGCENVRLHATISEEQLINLYRTSDALLLPLLDATANNALLESMACGTPVISTSIGGIPDYVNATAGWLFKKGEVRAIVELIKDLCDNRAIALSRRHGAREKSLEFDWRQIMTQMLAAYETVRK
jgi:glycosyltransferase involved in cell wall biosynthesis